MSADNWAVCPKCKAAAEFEKAAKRKAADAAYGKLPSEEWRALADKADLRTDPELSLREDYHIGVGEDGLFEANYRACCQDCDFEFSYKEKRRAWGPAS